MAATKKTKQVVLATIQIEDEVEIETEKQFLLRLLAFQHNGGWGRHLDQMILTRVKSINTEDDTMWVENGQIISQASFENKENPKDWYE